MNDEEMTERLFNRDRQALAEIKREYEGLCIHAAGKILSQREDIEECVNQAFFELWNRIPPAKPESLRSYLCKIVKNTAIDMLKYNTAEKRSPELTVYLDELDRCIPAAIGEGPDAQALGEAISRFLHLQEERHRRIFVRRYWYGDTVAEIAKRFDMNERTVATCLYRTRKKLKTFLEKEVGYNE